MKKKAKNLSRLQIMNFYIKGANTLINLAQNAINDPTANNFSKTQQKYEEWVLGVYNLVDTFDKKSAENFLGAPDGIHTSLNFLEPRLKNIRPRPSSFSTGNNGTNYADENGLKMLENIIVSVKEKIVFLNNLKLRITGGVLGKKNTKITISFFISGKITTNINDKSVQKRRGSILLRIIEKIRERDGTKLLSVSKDIGITPTNISREITGFNKQMSKTWPKIKEPVISNETGYCMNKKVYNFYYEDLEIDQRHL